MGNSIIVWRKNLSDSIEKLDNCGLFCNTDLMIYSVNCDVMKILAEIDCFKND